MDVGGVGKALVVAGLVLVGLGALIVLGSSLGLGRLPGDIELRRGNWRVYAPLASSLILSLVVTLVLNLILRK
jgi:hypothetical protein